MDAPDEFKIMEAIRSYVSECLAEPPGGTPRDDCRRLVRCLEKIERTLDQYTVAHTIQ